MDSSLILQLVATKLRDRSTYVLALVVGAIINLYGQYLLPWFRGSFDPSTDFLIEYEIRPEITVFSVFLGFAFPFFVGLYSAVATRYKNRRIEAISRLPEFSPDPMFRADRSGHVRSLIPLIFTMIVYSGFSVWLIAQPMEMRSGM